MWLASMALMASTRSDAEALVRAGIAAAESEEAPDPELLFSHAYVDPPPSLDADLAELRRILGG